MTHRRPPASLPPRTGDIRVLIVDDHPIVRKGLKEVLSHVPDIDVCGESDGAEGALALIRSQNPDVAIIDLSLGLASGLDLVKSLSMIRPHIRLLVLSMHDETLHAERALAAGANGFIMKGEPVQTLVAAIRRVAGGGTYVSAPMAERFVARMMGRSARGPAASPLERLTDRERDVFSRIGNGQSTQAIAEALQLSVKTIETYRSRIKEKLGLANAVELTRAAITWTQT